jgi:hypothetical protein
MSLSLISEVGQFLGIELFISFQWGRSSFDQGLGFMTHD